MSQRGVWNFTFRDSEADFINVTVWGSPAFIESCTDEFHVGSVGECLQHQIFVTASRNYILTGYYFYFSCLHTVSITKARITFRVTGGTDDNFRPSVSR